MIITGPRGVGKTVLLNEFRDRAVDRNWVVIEIEILKHDDDQFRRILAREVWRALFEIAPRKRWKERVKRAAAVLSSFSLTVYPNERLSAGLEVEALEGRRMPNGCSCSRPSGSWRSTKARLALADPVEACEASYSSEALDLALEFTDGYPYSLQGLGQAAWNLSEARRCCRRAAGQNITAMRTDVVPAHPEGVCSTRPSMGTPHSRFRSSTAT